MRTTEERYISLLTDFGFKRIFGTKPNDVFVVYYESENGKKSFVKMQN